MPLLGIGALASGIGSLFGIGASVSGQKSANKTNLAIADKTNQTNIQLAEQARAHDVAMWERQNEYNTPQMQMQRLKEAGLNPNLIYDSGAGSVGNAGSPQKAPVPHAERAQVQNEMAAMASMQILPAIAQFQDWQVKKAQIDNIKAQTDSIQANAIGRRLENYILEQQKPFANIDAMTRSGLLKRDLDLKDLQFQRDNLDTLIRVDNQGKYKQSLLDSWNMPKYQLEALKLGNKQRLLDIELDRDLKPYGLHRGDAVWMRILPKLFNYISPNLNKSLKF